MYIEFFRIAGSYIALCKGGSGTNRFLVCSHAKRSRSECLEELFTLAAPQFS